MLKNIFKNLILSFFIILFLGYIIYTFLLSLKAIFTLYFLIIILAIYFILSIFIPFLLRWIYLKEFDVRFLLIPGLIAIIVGFLVIYLGFGMVMNFEKLIIDEYNKKIEKKAQFDYYEEFKREFVEKNSSKYFGKSVFIPNSFYLDSLEIIPMDDDYENNGYYYKGHLKVFEHGVYPNELYYNNYILDKNEFIIQEYLDLLEQLSKDNIEIVESIEEYNFTNVFEAYFKQETSQRILHELYQKIVEFDRNEEKIRDITIFLLDTVRNDSIDSLKVLREKKVIYDINIDKHEESLKLCEGIFSFSRKNLIFFNQIGDCKGEEFLTNKSISKNFYGGYIVDLEEKNLGLFSRSLFNFEYNFYLSSSFWIHNRESVFMNYVFD